MVDIDLVSKNPIRIFNELLTKYGFKDREILFEYIINNKRYIVMNDGVFECVIKLQGNQVSNGKGNSRKTAKRQACINGIDWIGLNIPDE